MRRGGLGADRPAALLAASVVVALSTRSETFAGLALEAQALGTPVIVADAGAARETILAPPDVDPSSRTGWAVSAGEAEALAKALMDVLSPRSRRRRSALVASEGACRGEFFDRADLGADARGLSRRARRRTMTAAFSQLG